MNILGESVFSALECYKLRSLEFESYEEFFLDYLEKILVKADEASCSVVKDELTKTLSVISEELSNDDIQSMLEKTKTSLCSRNILVADVNIVEFVGYVLLGNIYSNEDK